MSAHENPPLGPRAIHAPWRLEYLERLESDRTVAPTDGGGFIHHYWLHPERDREHHVVVRTDAGLILLNRFPYAAGHLLVALGEPRPRLLDYSPGDRATLWALVDLATDLIERTLQPQGINIGVNQGRAAGAGLPQHLHVHLVPRWGGDVNFMTVVGQIRVIPASLDVMADRFRATYRSLGRSGRGGTGGGPAGTQPPAPAGS